MIRNFFQRTLIFIKDWIEKMIQPNSVTRALQIDTVLSSKMTEALQTWVSMYVDEASWLNGDPVKPVKSLRLPSTIASEIARMVTIEMEVDISGSPRADYLKEQLGPILTDIKQIVEQGSAKGGFVLKPYPQDGLMPIDVVYADAFYPVRFNSNRRMTSCVFSYRAKVGNTTYTRLEHHDLVNGRYSIKNIILKGTNDTTLGYKYTNISSIKYNGGIYKVYVIPEVPEWDGIFVEVNIDNVERPLFAYFRPPLANNIDPNSPLGVSCYARAVELIRDADELYAQLKWEFKSGERAMYVDETALAVNTTTGNQQLASNRLIRTLGANGNVGEGKKLYDEWSPEFRDEAHRRGLNDIFKRIEFNCGLAYGTLSDPAVIERTATEIVAAKQRSASTVVDNQKALQDALDDTLYAMDVWATVAKTSPQGTYSAAYSFDDSVVVDHDTQFQQDFQVASANMMPDYVFLMRNYGLSEVDAKKWVDEKRQESQAAMDLFGGGQVNTGFTQGA